ncbi:hypothetical protein DL95DRAFT_495044 [Leptodontidium sp. 2 PMI_412]|nr:hypothetical protein DL95DRAFT_495044 [Leptodontidium sp. 2 PMI_412]
MTIDDLFRGIDVVVTALLARPKVYALLGLCSPEEVAKNPIWYDLEPEEVYRTSTVSHTQLHNDLDFLGLCTPAQRDDLLSGPLEDLKSRLGKLHKEHQFFCASGAIPVDPTFKGDELMISEPLPSPNELLGMFHRWCRGSTLGEQLEQRGLGRNNSASWANGTKTFMGMKRLMSWEPFVTEQGYIGLAREKCSVGDEIWIIGGCSVPILLSTKAESPSSHYEVRGETFLDGFMFGEIMNMERVKRRSIRRVTLV